MCLLLQINDYEAKKGGKLEALDSAYLRLGTSYQCSIWRMSISSIFMFANHFPYLPIVTNPENNPCIQTVIRITNEI